MPDEEMHGIGTLVAVEACRMRDVALRDFYGSARFHHITKTRFAVCWVLNKFIHGYTLHRTKAAVGYTNHTSVLHAVAKIDRWIGEGDEELLDFVLDLLAYAKGIESKVLRPVQEAA